MNRIYFKAIKDLWASKAKTLLVLIALVIGIFGLGTIIYTYSITKRDLKDNYLNTNPASVIVNGGNISSSLMEKIAALDYISNIERRNLAILRARSNSSFNRMPIYVFSVTDFSNLRLNTFSPENGNSPGMDEILIERDGLQFLDGEDLMIQTEDNSEIVLHKTGAVHDPGLPPSHMDHVLWGYVSEQTFQKNFKVNTDARLLIKFNHQSLSSIQKDTEKLIRFIADNGGIVKQYTIPPPNEHPHEGQLQSLLFLQLGMGGLAVLLSILLLINVISSIMSEQIRQIGIMKSSGASRQQLIVMYTAGIGALTFAAQLIALPMAYKVSLAYSGYIAEELNFDVLNASIPLVLNMSLVIFSFGLPLLVALFPVLKATSISVKEALNHQNNGVIARSGNIKARKFSITPLWLSIAYNNTFLNKARLVLSVFTLMLGLGLFSVGLNISSSLDNTFQNNLQKKRYDFTIGLKRTATEDEVRKSLNTFPEIKNWELWNNTKGNFADKNGVKSGSFSVSGVKDETKMWDFQLIEGKLPATWNNSVVVNPEFIGKFPHVTIGDSVSLFIGGNLNTWYIAGLIKDIGAAGVYTTGSVLQQKANEDLLLTDIRIKAGESATSFSHLIMEVEDSLEKEGMHVNSSLNQSEFLILLRDHIGVIMSFLLAMASLVLLIGGLGIISLMNMNIWERRKEIGIMRATGAGKWQINKIIAVEMLLFGTMSWIFGWMVSFPLSRIISDFFGNLILETPLDFLVNQQGLFITFFVMTGILFLSGVFPIRTAMRLSVNKALN